MTQGNYIWLDNQGTLTICSLRSAQVGWTVVAEALEDGEDPEVGLKNPFANSHDFYWPENMFGPVKCKYSELAKLYAATGGVQKCNGT